MSIGDFLNLWKDFKFILLQGTRVIDIVEGLGPIFKIEVINAKPFLRCISTGHIVCMAERAFSIHSFRS